MKRLYKILKQLAPEKLFLTIAIPFGLLFLITIPALQGWDEATHFLRTYQISEGHMTASEVGPSDWGGQLPITVLQMNDAFVSDLVQSAQSNLERSVHTRAYLTYLTEFTPSPETAARGFSSSAVYSPVAYAPQAFAIAIAKLVHLPLISYIYIGRLAVFALWLFLTFQAIKRIPFGKWLIVAVGLLPTTMTVAVSLAPDALVVGCSALLVALFADYLVKPRRISQRDLLLIVALSITLAVTKQTYILLAGMFLFLPFQVYRTKKRYFATNGLIIGLALLTAIAWFAVVANISQDIHITQRPGIAVSPAEQTTYVASNPHEYGAILTNNIVNNNSNPQLLQATGL